MKTQTITRNSPARRRLSLILLIATAPLFPVLAVDPVPGREPQAPPVPPPVVKADSGPLATSKGPELDPPILWSIGQPTDEEQLYLEYINRSRANPPAEGGRLASTTDPDVLSAYSYFSVDLSLMQSQFNAIPAVPPLAMSIELMQAARLHSGDMFTNQFQGHTGSTGSTLVTRVTAQGYAYGALGENVFSYAESVWHGHAGFNVDWGSGPGGMQTPPGHRNNIHNGTMREVGVGVVLGNNGSVGPQLVTQDFGVRQVARPFVTGVVYFDFNGNQFYDLGEGIGGVTVESPGSSYYAVTASSGGYAVPVTTNGNYVFTFTAPGLSTQTVVQIAGAANKKLDLRPVYQPPVISGPNPALLNQPNAYGISSVTAAVGYDWTVATLASYTALEGAESLANVTIVSSPGYAVQATSPRYAGTYSFHLAHPQDPSNPTDQFIQLNADLRIESGSVLSFYKRLGWATATQVARAQVSTDSGASWTDVWSQAGTGGAGESSFSLVTVPLGAFGGAQARIRFVYDYTGGTYFYQTDSGVGLYLDNITVSGASFLVGPITNSIPSGAAFSFTPPAATNYLMAARARLPGRVLNWGPGLQVSATAPPPALQLAGAPTLAGGQVQVNFAVSNYRAGMVFELLKASGPEGPWNVDAGASLQSVVPNSQYRFTTATGGAPRSFYRVRGQY